MPDINGHFSVGKQTLHRLELSTAPWEVHLLLTHLLPHCRRSLVTY